MNEEKERRRLVELKELGLYDLNEHLDNHPVGGLVKRGARLPDDHALSILKRRKRNFMFSGIDWSKVVAVAPDRKRYNHPVK